MTHEVEKETMEKMEKLETALSFLLVDSSSHEVFYYSPRRENVQGREVDDEGWRRRDCRRQTRE